MRHEKQFDQAYMSTPNFRSITDGSKVKTNSGICSKESKKKENEKLRKKVLAIALQ